MKNQRLTTRPLPPASRPAPPSRDPAGPGADARAGFTLIELMVAIAVLVMMMAGFGVIMSQGQRVVTTSQEMIRANAEATAISQMLRRDLARITQSGFLAIVGAGNDTPPALIFTATGPFASRVTDDRSNAAIICYSIRGPLDNPSLRNVLVREAQLLATPWPSIDPNTSLDIYPPLEPKSQNNPHQLSHLKLATRSKLGYLVTGNNDISHVGYFVKDGYLTVPTYAQDLLNVQEIWPLMAKNCRDLSVQWLDDAGNWYGFWGLDRFAVRTKFASPADDLEDLPTNPEDGDPESVRGTNNAYMALWTHHDMSNWPRAIRVRFRLGNLEDHVRYQGITHHTNPGSTDLLRRDVGDDSPPAWIENEWAGFTVRLNDDDKTDRLIIHNNADTLTIDDTMGWNEPPGDSQSFQILIPPYEVVCPIRE